LPICFFFKPDFDWNSENQKSQILPGFLFSRKGLGSGKTLSQLHIHYKSLLTRVYSMVMQDAKNIAKLLLLPWKRLMYLMRKKCTTG